MEKINLDSEIKSGTVVVPNYFRKRRRKDFKKCWACGYLCGEKLRSKYKIERCPMCGVKIEIKENTDKANK